MISSWRMLAERGFGRDTERAEADMLALALAEHAAMGNAPVLTRDVKFRSVMIGSIVFAIGERRSFVCHASLLAADEPRLAFGEDPTARLRSAKRTANAAYRKAHAADIKASRAARALAQGGST